MALRKTKIVEPPSDYVVQRSNEIEPVENVLLKDTVQMEEEITMAEASKSNTPSVGEQKLTNMDWTEKYEEIKPLKTVSMKGAALSIVNNKNSKRVKITDLIIKELYFPNAVRLLVNEVDREVYILSAEGHENAHNLKGKPTKNMVYSAGLVERLTSLFELDYSSRTSHSIGTWTVKEEEGTKMICVTLAEEVQETPTEELQELNEEQNPTTQSLEPVAE